MIFISYKREDEATARDLYKYFREWEHEAWLDVEHIMPGENWDSAIHNGLRNSTIIVGLLAPESVASENVLDEWGYALSTNKRLLLLHIRKTNEEDIPHRYIRLQRLNFYQDFEKNLEILQDILASPTKLYLPSEKPSLESKLESNEESVPKLAATENAYSSANPQIISVDFSSTISTLEESKNQQYSKFDNVRTKIIDKVHTFWIDGVLKSALEDVQAFSLSLVPRNDIILRHADYGDYVLPKDVSLIDIYKDVLHELLILGAPGSGKTILLLQLAQGLLDQARSNPRSPIPIILNLSSWGNDGKESIRDWFLRRMIFEYQVPRRIARTLLDNAYLLPLFDGLDEVPQDRRNDCVLAINEFKQDYNFLPGIIVCSRVHDYEQLADMLNIATALQIQPLDADDVQVYLDTNASPELRTLIENDSEVQDMVKNPYFLNTILYTYKNRPITNFAPQKGDYRKNTLFTDYLHKRFQTHEHYTFKQTRDWLTFLSQRMVEQGTTIFYMEDISWRWLTRYRDVLLYLVSFTVLLFLTASGVISIIALPIAGIANAINASTTVADTPLINYDFGQSVSAVITYNAYLVFSLFVVALFPKGTIKRIIFSVIVGFITVLVIFSADSLSRDATKINSNFLDSTTLALISLPVMIAPIIFVALTQDIQILDRLKLRWRRLTLCIILAIASSAYLVNSQGLWAQGYPALAILNGVVTVPGLCLFFALISGSIQSQVGTRPYPNFGIFQSAKYALMSGVLTFIFFILPLWIFTVENLLLENDSPSRIWISFIRPDIELINSLLGLLLAGVTVSTTIGIIFGGRAVLQHLIVRMILRQNGSTPSNYREFLDYSTEMRLVRKVGGAYIFIHRYMLEYFSQLKTSLPQKKYISLEKQRRGLRFSSGFGGFLVMISLVFPWFTIGESGCSFSSDYVVIPQTYSAVDAVNAVPFILLIPVIATLLILAAIWGIRTLSRFNVGASIAGLFSLWVILIVAGDSSLTPDNKIVARYEMGWQITMFSFLFVLLISLILRSDEKLKAIKNDSSLEYDNLDESDLPPNYD